MTVTATVASTPLVAGHRTATPTVTAGRSSVSDVNRIEVAREVRYPAVDNYPALSLFPSLG